MTIGGEPAVLFKNVFPKTPSGKVELASGYLETRSTASGCPASALTTLRIR